HATDGVLTGWDDAYLGRMTYVAKPAGLLDDLVAVGFVDETPQGRSVHGWMKRNGAFLRGNAASEGKAAGGRKGGKTRAETGERDSMGRYKPSLDEVWSRSGPDSGPE